MVPPACTSRVLAYMMRSFHVQGCWLSLCVYTVLPVLQCKIVLVRQKETAFQNRD